MNTIKRLVVCMILLCFSLLLSGRVTAEEKERKIIFQSSINFLGDEEVETIVLSGVEKEGSPFYEDIKITVFEEKTGKLLHAISPNVNYGFNPKLSIIDFDLDGISEVFYSAESGLNEKNGYFYVFSFNGEFNVVYDFEVDINPFTAKYQNYYKVSVKRADKEFLIDISSKGSSYLNKLYTPNGKLQKQCLATVSKVNSVIPYYNYLKNEYFIKVVRKVSGENASDFICNAACDLEFKNGKFIPLKTYVEI